MLPLAPPRLRLASAETAAGSAIPGVPLRLEVPLGEVRGVGPKTAARLAQLGLDQLNDDLPTRERTAARKEAEKITKVLKECQAWEQDALLPLAQQRIELDLDDGVKVNYLKLQDVLAVIPGLAAKED